jgi:fibronectin-binding autotransporter adhesin
LSKILDRMACLQTLALTWTLSGALLLSEPPSLVFAAPSYTVGSDLDAHKDGAFPAVDCRSTLTPDHPCTLRAAVETANTAASGASIDVPGNLVITLDPALGELGPNVPMSITSTGGGGAIVDGRLQTRVFRTTDATTGVTISGLTVRHGKPTTGSEQTGGGIWNDGTLTLNNVVVTLSQGKNAGGIVDTGTLTINGGAVSGNTAIADPMSGDSSVAGGLGVTSGGVVAINGTSFTNNRADFAGGIGTFGTTILRSGLVTNNSANRAGGGLLAGISSSNPDFGPADVTITDSTIRGNTAGNGGGGIFLGAGQLGMSGSTVSGNDASAGSGGGMLVTSSSASLTNDTLSGNVAAQGGGGIAQSTFNIPRAGVQGGVGPSTSLSAQLTQVEKSGVLRKGPKVGPKSVRQKAVPDDVTLGWVTLAGNSARTGGGILNEAGLSFMAHDSIVAGNTGVVGTNCSGSVTSGGHNLQSASDCGFGAIGDRSNSDPKLGGLANNGGPTQTMALQTGSAAIDAGGPCPPPVSDQRGVSRPQGAECDMGAFESMAPIPAPPPTGR